MPKRKWTEDQLKRKKEQAKVYYRKNKERLQQYQSTSEVREHRNQLAAERRKTRGLPNREEFLKSIRKTAEQKKMAKKLYEKKRYQEKRNEILEKQKSYYYGTNTAPINGRRGPKLSPEEIKARHRERERKRRLELGMTPKSEIPLLTDAEKKLRKKKRMAQYYEKNKEKLKAKTREYWEKNKETLRKKHRERGKKYYEQNSDMINKKDRERRARNRLKCLDHFGGRCQCECGCTESDYGLLTLAHPNNDGAEDRRKNGDNSATLCAKLIKNNFKHEFEISIECFNCNMGKENNKNICPKTKKI